MVRINKVETIGSRIKTRERYNRALHLQKMEEQLRKIVSEHAKSVDTKIGYKIEYNKDMLNSSTIKDKVFSYQGVLATSDSVWAPWSINGRLK